MLLSKPLNPSQQALSSLKLIKLRSSSSAYHLSSSSHLHSTPKSSPSPSPAPAPGVAVASPSPSPRRRTPLSPLCLTAHPRPCRHRPIFPSNPSSNLAVTAAPPPCSPRRPSPLQVSALFSFLVNFFNCCFGLIFLGLVLILC